MIINNTKNNTSKNANTEKRHRGIKGTIAIICITLISLMGGIVFLETRSNAENRTEVTNTIIEERLSAIGELATYQMDYTNVKIEENTRTFFNLFEIPLTTNSIVIRYEGVIKAGYRVSDIHSSVDMESKVIKVTLPEVGILSNDIDLAKVQFIENNNILNPIKCESITNYVQELEAQEQRRAIEKGIYRLAEENAKTLILEKLEDFEDFEVVFINAIAE